MTNPTLVKMYTQPLVPSNILSELPKSLAKEDGKFMNVPNDQLILNSCLSCSYFTSIGSRFLLTMAPFIQVDLHPRASFIGLMFLLEPHEFRFFSQIP
jgi:hypothetical protein